MKLNRIAVAIAAISMAGAAVAAGNAATTTSPSNATTPPSNMSSSSHAATPSSSTTSMPSSASDHSTAMNQPGSSGEQNDPATVRSVQHALKEKGFDAGAIDGRMGPSTEKALRDFQQAQGISQSGNLDEQTLTALGVEQGHPGMQSGGTSTYGTPGSQEQGASSNTSTQNRDLMKDRGTNNGTQTSHAPK